MILQALARLAKQEQLLDDLDFELKPVPWLVVVQADGGGARIVPTRNGPPTGKAADSGKVFRIPRQLPARSGAKAPPEFLVDNPRFVFGAGTHDKPIQNDADLEKAKARAVAFLTLVRRCATETGDEAVAAVQRFLEGVHDGSVTPALDPETRANDLFAFVYAPDGDRLVTDRPKVEAYWRSLRARGAGEPVRRCVVTGRLAPAAHKHKFLKNLPGATSSGAALVSFSGSSFESYGWKGHENGPVSMAVAEACGAALTRLLDPAFPDPTQAARRLPRSNIQLSADTVVCYWTADRRENEFCSVFDALLQPDPERVSELYRSISRGRWAGTDDPTPFYALTISGALGRAAVRGWIESTVGRVANNLAAHFCDMEIRRNTPKPKDQELPEQMSLGNLLAALAPEKSLVPGTVLREVLRAVLEGSLYPFAMLQLAVLRERAEIGRRDWIYHVRRDARAAIIKAVLNRRMRFQQHTGAYQQVQPTMDPMNSSEGYTLGRLMAVVERLQQTAFGGVNPYLVERHFSAASGSPIRAFVPLLRNARDHASRAWRDPDSRGIAFLLVRLIDHLAGRFSPERNGFPPYLDLEQQGLFIVGYHQMRHWLWMTNEERAAWEEDHPNAPPAYLWKSGRPQVDGGMTRE